MLPWGKTGQIAHLSSPLSGIAQKTILARHTTVATRGFGMGGAGAKTLRITTLSLVYSAAEYCTPVWCRSAHTRLIDSVLNDALRIVTGCLRPTPTDHLPVLSGIQPAELRRLWSETLLGLPWISGPRSYLAWSFKWVLRYSPNETKIQTPVCARCAESLGQSCQTWHPRL